MKFFNRERELQQLAEIRDRAFYNHSQMTIVTGRRRIGKTKLMMKSCEGSQTVYLFVSRNNEATAQPQPLKYWKIFLSQYFFIIIKGYGRY